MQKLLWLDLETTGLSEVKDVILEVGAIVTDQDYNIIDKFSETVCWDDHVLQNMNDWCKKTHGESGLIKECQSSPNSMYTLNDKLIDFIKKHFPEQKPVLHGNSVHFDKKFIDFHLPQVSSLLHYRLVDISSIKEFMRPLGISYKSDKVISHRAIDDLMGSIEEAKYYRNKICHCAVRV